jgi:hypothetical protein
METPPSDQKDSAFAGDSFPPDFGKIGIASDVTQNLNSNEVRSPPFYIA